MKNYKFAKHLKNCALMLGICGMLGSPSITLAEDWYRTIASDAADGSAVIDFSINFQNIGSLYIDSETPNSLDKSLYGLKAENGITIDTGNTEIDVWGSAASVKGSGSRIGFGGGEIITHNTNKNMNIIEALEGGQFKAWTATNVTSDVENATALYADGTGSSVEFGHTLSGPIPDRLITLTGTNTNGAQAINNGRVNMESQLTIDLKATTDNNGVGLKASDGGAIITGSVTVNNVGLGAGAYAVEASGLGVGDGAGSVRGLYTIYFYGEANLTSVQTGIKAYDSALVASNSDVNIRVTGAGDNSRGVSLESGAQLAIGVAYYGPRTGDLNIDTQGSAGLYVAGKDGAGQYSKASVNGNVTIDTYAQNAVGMGAYNGGIITVTDTTTIETRADGASAVDVNAGEVQLNGGALLITAGEAAYGMRAEGDGTKISGTDVQAGTKGDNAHALYVSGSDAAVVLSGDTVLHTEGETAHGVFVDADDSSVALDGAAKIITTTDASHAVYVEGNNNTVGLGDGAVSSTAGADAHSLYVAGEDIAINIGDDVTLQTAGTDAYGIYTAGINSKVTVGSSTVVTQGQDSHAIFMESDAGEITFTGTALLSTKQDNTYTAYVWGDENVLNLGTESQIGTQGSNAHALYAAGSGAEITIGDDATLQTEGANAYGIYTAGNNGTVTVGSSTVVTEGAEAHAIFMESDGSEITFSGAAKLGTAKDNTHAAYVYGSDNTLLMGDESILATKGNNAHAVYMWGDSARVGVGSDSVIETAGEGAHAVYNNSANGQAYVGGGTFIYTKGDGAHGIYTAGANAVTTLVGDIAIETESADAWAIYADNGKVASSDVTPFAATAGGRYLVTGNMLAANDGVIDLRMEENSVFTGTTALQDGDIYLTMIDSVWNVTGDSRLSELTLCGSVVDYRSSDFGTVIRTENLHTINNSAVFIMRADVANQTADRLVVSESLEGNAHFLVVSNNGAQTVTGDEVVVLVDTKTACNEKLSFALGSMLGRAVTPTAIPAVEVGGFKYALFQEAAVAPLDDEYDVNWVLRATGQASNDAEASINTFAAAYLLSYAEMQTLLQRLGDLRQTPDNWGVWVKGFGGRFDSLGSDFVSGFKMNYHGVQAGVDYKTSVWQEYGDMYLGGMFGYSKGDISHNSGRGSVDMKTVGIYGTFIAKSGFYVDAVLKYGWMENDFKVLDTQQAYVTGEDMKTSGLGASVEIGQRIHFDRQSYEGVYIEPQGQLSYQHQSGGNFNTSSGLNVKVDNFDSFMGRLGANLGYEIKHNPNFKYNVYLKGSYVHEFDGDVGTRLNGTRVKESFGDDWFTYGVGVTMQINEKHSLYADFEAASGGQFKQPWSVNGGYRISF